jgi:hypothetical protein
MEDLNAQAKQAVEETKEQALGAADTYFDFLNKTVASFPSGVLGFTSAQHAAALSAASSANRSRRLLKCDEVERPATTASKC